MYILYCIAYKHNKPALHQIGIMPLRARLGILRTNRQIDTSNSIKSGMAVQLATEGLAEYCAEVA